MELKYGKPVIGLLWIFFKKNLPRRKPNTSGYPHGVFIKSMSNKS